MNNLPAPLASLFFSVWFFNLSLRELDVSVAATIRGLFFLVTTVLAVVIAKEQPSTIGVVAMCLAAGAVLLLGIDAVTK
jgi:multidrug transporter EmrE-like cation transporter|tara:strand:+ start:1230 stop:1466 length:237 start_codon:yes stop_codon:yes gene_type:complete